MSALRSRAGRGARAGLVAGLVYGVADLLSAAIAIGWLFDPGWPSILLVAFALGTNLGLGALFGAILGLVPWKLPKSAAVPALVALAVVVLVAGVFARWERNHDLDPVGEPAPDAKPVLFVVTDTLRADTLYGDAFEFPLAPSTRNWAMNARVFEDAESSAGWTIPSMATMLTGVHNTTYDASAGRLPLWGKTLAEHLRERGYETRAVVDNVILEPRNGFAQGFESFDQRSAFRFAFTFPSFRLWPIEVHEWLRGALFSAYDGSRDVTDRAIERIEEAGDRPLLLYVHYMDPHAPYYPHADLPPVDGEAVDYYRFRDYLREGVDKPPSLEQLRWLRGRYEREVTHWDADFGRLIVAWKKRYGDQGLIVLTSDHGEEFLDHGRLGHGMTVHREMVHVPLIVDPPADTCGGSERVPELVSLLDLTPTVVEWVTGEPAKGSEGGPAIQGRSWVRWLCEGGEAPERPAFALHARHGRKVYRYRTATDVALQIRYFDDPNRRDRMRYAFTEDPTENNPLPADDATGDRLFRDLSKLTKAFENARDSNAEDESEAVEESLRALGYIQ